MAKTTSTKKKDKLSEEQRKKKQERARLRRQVRDRDAKITELIPGYMKPLDQWDEEELAKGRPKDEDGTFRSGPAPKWISRSVHEEAVRRFQNHAQAELRGMVPKALATIQEIILDNRVDDRGRPVVPQSVRADCAKWVVEHLVGKPKQQMEVDISVKLQGILATALVQPDAVGELSPATITDWDDVEDAEIVEEGD